MEVSIVIPVHNEAGNIQRLIEEISAVPTATAEFEIVVVDDGSDDHTLDVLRQLGRDHAHLRVLAHRRRCGQSTSLVHGVRAARGKTIVTLDGDGQNDPRDIPRLLATLNGNGIENLRMVTGHRRQRRDTRWRRVSSRIANAVRRRLLRDDTPDTGCGLKAFSREAFLRLPYFDHMHRFLPALVQRDGGAVVSVDVNHRPRQFGSSHYGTFGRLMVGVVDLAGILWLIRRSHSALAEELVLRADDAPPYPRLAAGSATPPLMSGDVADDRAKAA